MPQIARYTGFYFVFAPVAKACRYELLEPAAVPGASDEAQEIAHPYP